MAQTIITVSTSGQGLYEFTGEAADFVRRSAAATGLLTVFVRHTSASLLIQENADPDGRLLLGTWQGLYLFEHRNRPHRREVVLHIGA